MPRAVAIATFAEVRLADVLFFNIGSKKGSVPNASSTVQNS
jgi:hypothetical protein